MAVRPPQDNIDEEPDTVAFGIAALDSRLDREEVTFPTDEKALRSSVGQIEIPYNASGSTISLDSVLDQTSKQQFESKRELLNAVHPVFEQHRMEGGTDILARIRSFIPF